MADIAPLLITPQPPPQSTAQTSAATGDTSGSETSFSAELDNAVAARQKTNDSKTSSENPSHEQNTNQSVNAENESNDTPDGSDSILSQAFLEKSTESHQQSTDSSQLFQAITKAEYQNYTSIRTASIQLAFSEQLTLQNTGQAGPDSLSTPVAASENTHAIQSSLQGNTLQMQIFGSATVSQTFTGQESLADQSMYQSAFATNAEYAVSSVPAATEPLLSNQLQELIKNNETGTITINKQPSSAATFENLNTLTRSPFFESLATATSTGQATAATAEGTNLSATFNHLTNLKTSASEVADKPVSNKLETLRQDSQGHFMDAKLNAQTKNNPESANQQSTQQETVTQGQLLSSQSGLSNPEQPTAFSQTLHGAQAQSPTQLQQTMAMPQPSSPLPPGTQIYEDSIMNQVTERFQLNFRNQETQLHIKLQPAELGELKIDLNMKDGAIRAHVVAQSGQVQEILEKNMTKLKEMLEGQGLTIEEIIVSQKTDAAGSFDLFQDHLAKGDSQSSSNSRDIDATFSDTFDEIVSDTAEPATGVNLKV
jgi:flagellar hook-length control protein FliK